jgi:hypothetical protein
MKMNLGKRLKVFRIAGYFGYTILFTAVLPTLKNIVKKDTKSMMNTEGNTTFLKKALKNQNISEYLDHTDIFC